MSTPGRPRILRGFDKILHGGDYNPDQWLSRPEIIDEDFRLMKLAGCNTFAVGIFAWARCEPEEGRYDFDWLDRIFDRLEQAQHNVILATPSGAKPPWMSLKYPEIRRVTELGLREPQRDRHNHCWTSPVYRAKVRAINEQLAQRYGKRRGLSMWHISNEYSGACYCHLCLSAFHGWLERKYENLAALNDAYWSGFWGHTFTSFSEVDPRDGCLDGMALDFKRFNTWQIGDFFDFEAEPLRRHSPEIPCTTNFMGVIDQVDYAALARHVDVVTDDQYPCYQTQSSHLLEQAPATAMRDDLYRCFKPDRPWMLMESTPDTAQWNPPMRLKRPGIHRTEMLQALGHGAEGTCYFQWRKGLGGGEKFHGAVVDHVGHEHTRVFQTVASLGAEYERLSRVLGTAVEAEVAMLYDTESRWGMRLSGGLHHQPDAYYRVFLNHYSGLWAQNLSIDIFESTRTLQGYKLVVVPQLWLLKPGVADNLKQFVTSGGTLVVTNCTAICDQYNRCFTGGWPGGGLMELLGIWEEEFDCVDPKDENERNFIEFQAPNDLGLKGHHATLDIRSILHLRGATALATFTEDFYAGRPALTVNRVGNGQAYFLGARMSQPFLDEFYAALTRSLGLRSALPVAVPRGVSAQRRVGHGREHVFVENFSGTSQELDLSLYGYTDTSTGTPVTTLSLGRNMSAAIERPLPAPER